MEETWYVLHFAKKEQNISHQVAQSHEARRWPQQKPRGASKWQSTNEKPQNFLPCTAQGDHSTPD